MNTDEKIAAYSEKVEVKKKKLDEINAVIEKKKTAAAALKADIDALSKNIFELEAQRLFSMLKDKGIGIGTVIEAVSTGIFDDENSAANSKENGAINSTIEQEENKNESTGVISNRKCSQIEKWYQTTYDFRYQTDEFRDQRGI